MEAEHQEAIMADVEAVINRGRICGVVVDHMAEMIIVTAVDRRNLAALQEGQYFI